MHKFLTLLALFLLAACASTGKSSTYKSAAQWPAKRHADDQKIEALLPFLTGGEKATSGKAQAAAPAPAPAPAPSASEGYFVASVDEVVPVDMQDLPDSMRGILPLSGRYQLKIRKMGGAPAGAFGYGHGLITGDSNDLSSYRRSGFVTVKAMEPGSYEIYSYNVRWREAKGKDRTVTADAPFSIPFTIEAGKTTYLGNYGAVGFSTKNGWGISKPAGAYFLVTDLAERDLKIAKGKMPELGPPVKAVPDPDALHSPAFKAARAAQ